MFSGDQIASLLSEVGVTHVITVPDSTIGRWEPAIERTGRIRLVRVCREGEAWQVAAGLYLGGATPIHDRAGNGVFPVVFAIVFGGLVWVGLVLREPRLLRIILLRE